jgi:hypothetical protein
MSEMSEDEIEKLAWELETKMMEIRRDPRAALAAGLARIRETMCAEYEADMAKRETGLAKADAFNDGLNHHAVSVSYITAVAPLLLQRFADGRELRLISLGGRRRRVGQAPLARRVSPPSRQRVPS